MALTERERSIVQQVKSQWWTKQQVIEVLNQERARQPQQEFKSLSQEARESLTKTPEELLWVDSFREDPVEQVEGEWLGTELEDRWENIKEAITQKQTFFKPWLFSEVREWLEQHKEGQEIISKIDKFNEVIDLIPWSDTLKWTIGNIIDQKLTDAKVWRNIVWAVNDIIWEWINKVLEFTWANKLIEKWIEEAGKTWAWQAVWEVVKEWTKTFSAIEEIAPWFADLLGMWWESAWLSLFWKWTQALKKVKAPKLSVWNQQVANKLVDTTLRFTASQKNKFKKPTLSWWKSPAEYLFEKWIIQGSKTTDDVVEKLANLTKTSKTQVDSSLASIKDLYKHSSTSKWLNQVVKQLDDTPWMEEVFDRAKELSVKLDRWEGLLLKEVNEVKRLIDSTNDLVSVTGDFKSGVTKQGLQNIRNDIKTFIEKSADKKWIKNIKELNKDTQLSKQLLDTIESNLEESWRTRLFWLTDILVWWTATFGSDLWTAAAVIAAKKVAESPRFKIALAKRLNKLPTDTKASIKGKIASWEPLTRWEKAILSAIVISVAWWEQIEDLETNQ